MCSIGMTTKNAGDQGRAEQVREVLQATMVTSSGALSGTFKRPWVLFENRPALYFCNFIFITDNIIYSYIF